MKKSDTTRTPEVEQLLSVLGLLETNDERYALLMDLATIDELEDMSQRLVIAHQLRKGKTYKDIEDMLGASATTVARVSKCLHHGQGGYETALQRLEESPDHN